MAATRTGPQEHVASLAPARSGSVVEHATRAEYVVLTRSDELLEHVGLALDGAGEVRHAENEEDARHLADARHATVMLLDSREQVDPGLVVERLHASDGSTVIVVFAPSEVMADVARVIKGSAAFAVLPVPIEMDKTRAVLLGAGEEALARRALIASAAMGTPVRTGTDHLSRERDPVPERAAVDAKRTEVRAIAAAESGPPSRTAAGGGTPRAFRWSGIAPLVVVCMLIAATGAWLYLGDATEPPAQVTAGASEERATIAPAAAPRDELLDRARVAFHERRYAEPVRDNALYYYQGVLAQDPGDAEAREGLERIGAILEGRLEAALAERRTDDAARTLEQLRSIRPQDTTLAEAAAQLAEQRVAAALARGDAHEASELLGEAAANGVSDERLAQLRDRLARVDASRSVAPLSQPARARVRDGQQSSLPGDGAERVAAQGQGNEAVKSMRAAETPAAAREEIPAEPAVPAAVPAGPGLSAADFRRTRYVAPTYPAQALARGQSGEVRVRVTVDTDGRVTDVLVLSASPPGVFDQAAVKAVRKWRFEPVIKDGRAVEASVATTILFQPDDAARR